MDENYEITRRREAEKRRRTKVDLSKVNESSLAPTAKGTATATSESASSSINRADQVGTFETSAATMSREETSKIGVTSRTVQARPTSSCLNNCNSHDDDDDDIVALSQRLQQNKKKRKPLSMTGIENGIEITTTTSIDSSMKKSTQRQRTEMISSTCTDDDEAAATTATTTTNVDESKSALQQELPIQAMDSKNTSSRCCSEMIEDTDTFAKVAKQDSSPKARIDATSTIIAVASACTTKEESSSRQKIDAARINVDRTNGKARAVECIDLISSDDEEESEYSSTSKQGVSMDCPIDIDDDGKPRADQILADHEYAKRLQRQEEKRQNRQEQQQQQQQKYSSADHNPCFSSSEAPTKIFATKSDERERDKNPGDRQHWSRTQCWTLREMLGFDGERYSARSVDWMVVSNFIIDCAYLLNEVPELISVPHCVVFFGHTLGSFDGWKAGCLGLDVVHLNPSEGKGTNRIPYGCHHTKMFLVGFSDGTLRLIIHTANILYDDIHVKAQTAYIQDFPLKRDGVNDKTEFEDDLASYFHMYNYTHRRHWVGMSSGPEETLTERIRKYDFSSAKAVLIPSAPGYHKIHGNNRMYGHLKIREAVRKHAIRSCPAGVDDTSSIVCQFSSVGSLSKKYLLDLQRSMDANFDVMSEARKVLRLKLIFPTVEEIRTSIEGYLGGRTVPGPSKNVTKGFLQSLWHRWSPSRGSSNDNPLFKGKHVPHLKTFYQCDKDQSFLWLVLTSHNLSKAALGEVVNSVKYGEQRFFVRHWEMGVFISSRLLGKERLVPWSRNVLPSDNASVATIPLPFKSLPDKYEKSDEPWKWDVKSYPHPDRFGRVSA